MRVFKEHSRVKRNVLLSSKRYHYFGLGANAKKTLVSLGFYKTTQTEISNTVLSIRVGTLKNSYAICIRHTDLFQRCTKMIS